MAKAAKPWPRCSSVALLGISCPSLGCANSKRLNSAISSAKALKLPEPRSTSRNDSKAKRLRRTLRWRTSPSLSRTLSAFQDL